MTLKDRMESSGAWLFRWRSYLPVLVFPFLLPAVAGYRIPFGNADIAWIWDAFCVAVALCGFGVRVVTVGQTPRGTSGRNTRRQKADTLNTTGIYSLVRNPLYLGNFLIGLGVSMFPFSLYPPILYALFFQIYYERIVMAEEKFLRERFGRGYDEWTAKTPAFVPNWKNYSRSTVPFSWKKVLRREYTSLLGVAMAMTG
jgi:protein-S-isoprenylcysteine O-methyltransferase Ste14